LNMTVSSVAGVAVGTVQLYWINGQHYRPNQELVALVIGNRRASEDSSALFLCASVANVVYVYA
jgi:hypothetical protein